MSETPPGAPKRPTAVGVALSTAVAVAAVAALAQRVYVDRRGEPRSRIQGLPPGPRFVPPQIVAQPPMFDFHEVRAGSKVDKEFVLRNLGGAELVIESVDPTCGCTIAALGARRIPAGGSTALRVTLTAGPNPGPVQESVVVTSNALERRLEMRIAATVVAPGKPAPPR